MTIRTPFLALAAKGCIAAATYQIRVQISTARWIFPTLYNGPGDHPPVEKNCPFATGVPDPHIDRFIRFSTALKIETSRHIQTTLHVQQWVASRTCMRGGLTRRSKTTPRNIQLPSRAVFKGGGVTGSTPPPRKVEKKIFWQCKKARPAKCER